MSQLKLVDKLEQRQLLCQCNLILGYVEKTNRNALLGLLDYLTKHL